MQVFAAASRKINLRSLSAKLCFLAVFWLAKIIRFGGFGVYERESGPGYSLALRPPNFAMDRCCCVCTCMYVQGILANSWWVSCTFYNNNILCSRALRCLVLMIVERFSRLGCTACRWLLHRAGEAVHRLHVKMTLRFIARHHLIRVTIRVLFVGGSRGTSPSLDLTFPPTGLSENWIEWKGEERVRGKERVGETTCLTSPPPHWLLPQIPPWLRCCWRW